MSRERRIPFNEQLKREALVGVCSSCGAALGIQTYLPTDPFPTQRMGHDGQALCERCPKPG
jgi:hypothetical protein